MSDELRYKPEILTNGDLEWCDVMESSHSTYNALTDMYQRIDQLTAERNELRAEVEKHSCTTLDGVRMFTPKRVMVYQILWNDVRQKDVVQGYITNDPDCIRRMYSTREAAQAAIDAKGGE